jgi:hypothetical protein
MSSVSSLCLLSSLNFIKSLAKVSELMAVHWLSSIMFNPLAVLYMRAFLLLGTGLMGMWDCVV